VQQTLGFGTVASYVPCLLIKVRDWSGISGTSKASAAALYQIVQTLVAFTAIQQPPDNHQHTLHAAACLAD